MSKGIFRKETLSYYDRIWGTVNGIGNNRLGKILIQVREELRDDLQRRSKRFVFCS